MLHVDKRSDLTATSSSSPPSLPSPTSHRPPLTAADMSATMTAAGAPITCLKRKRDEYDDVVVNTINGEGSDGDAGTTISQPSLLTLDDNYNLDKRSKLTCSSATTATTVTSDTTSPSSSSQSSPILFHSTDTSLSLSSSDSSRRSSRRSPLLSIIVPEPTSTEADILLTPIIPSEAGPSTTPTTTSSVSDLQDSLVACKIYEPKHDHFGFDTTLSNVQYGFTKSKPYRFTSPLSPQPEKRRKLNSAGGAVSSKSRRHRSRSSSSSLPLLKLTLHRNHITSIRKRWPDHFRPRSPLSPTHPDSVPALDDDDDEFDDDEDDELIEDDSDDQVDVIVDMYTANPTFNESRRKERESTPEPEEPMSAVVVEVVECEESIPISMVSPMTLIPKSSLHHLASPRPKPLQISSLVNIQKELGSSSATLGNNSNGPGSNWPICARG